MDLERWIFGLLIINSLGILFKFFWSPEEKRAIKEQLKLAEAKSVKNYDGDMKAIMKQWEQTKEELEIAIAERDQDRKSINELKKAIIEGRTVRNRSGKQVTEQMATIKFLETLDELTKEREEGWNKFISNFANLGDTVKGMTGGNVAGPVAGPLPEAWELPKDEN